MKNAERAAARTSSSSSETESTAEQSTASKRGSIMSVRFTADERQLVAEAADMFEASPSTFVRAAAIDAVDAVRTAEAIAEATGGAPQVSSPQVPSAMARRAEAPGVLSDLPQVRELVELRTAVNKVGGNINQIARLANIEGLRATVTEIGSNDFVAILDEAVTVLSRVREVLTRPTGTVQLKNLTAAPDSPEASMPLGTKPAADVQRQAPAAQPSQEQS